MSLTTQFLTMLSMVGMGIATGASLDTYRRVIRRRAGRYWLSFINDTVFWIFQALLIFYVLYRVNRGELRFYVFLALLCGYSAYEGLIKWIYLNLLEHFLSLCRRGYGIMKKMWEYLILIPVKTLFSLLFSILLGAGKFFLGLATGLGKWLAFPLYPLSKLFLFFGKRVWNLLPKSFKIKGSRPAKTGVFNFGKGWDRFFRKRND